MPEARTTDERNLVLRRQSAITRIAHAGLQASTLDDFLAEALQIAADTMDVPTVAVLELFADQGMLEGRAVIYDGETIGPEGAALVRVPTGRGSMPGYTLLDDRVVVTTDLVGTGGASLGNPSSVTTAAKEAVASTDDRKISAPASTSGA